MDTKQAALDLAPTETYSAPAAAKTAKPPEKFTYALSAFTVQRRKSGWWISPASKGAGEKPQWSGPFATIETACLAIGRRLAIDIADRHTQSIERHGLAPDDPLYGLKPTTRLDAP
jgi:hypothetical protein